MYLRDVIDKFSTDNTIKLTQEEELLILEFLENPDYLGCGSSRAAYGFMDKYVVKVALSHEGQLQNRVEQEYYAEFGNRGYFAHLYAYGKLINVVELVDIYRADDEFNYEDVEELSRCVEELTGYGGPDNDQVGYSSIQEGLVLYDYGYSIDYDRDDLVGDMCEWTEHLNILELAIDAVEQDFVYFYDDLDDMCDCCYREENDCYDDYDDEYSSGDTMSDDDASNVD